MGAVGSVLVLAMLSKTTVFGQNVEPPQTLNLLFSPTPLTEQNLNKLTQAEVQLALIGDQLKNLRSQPNDCSAFAYEADQILHGPGAIGTYARKMNTQEEAFRIAAELTALKRVRQAANQHRCDLTLPEPESGFSCPVAKEESSSCRMRFSCHLEYMRCAACCHEEVKSPRSLMSDYLHQRIETGPGDPAPGRDFMNLDGMIGGRGTGSTIRQDYNFAHFTGVGQGGQ
jgi:hypothetical protein